MNEQDEIESLIHRLIVKYGALVGLAFFINLIYSIFNDLTVYDLYSVFRVFLFSIIMYLGAIWGSMDFDNPQNS